MTTPEAEAIAHAIHDAYEALAPVCGWRTNAACQVPWEGLPPENRELMLAVVQRLLQRGVILPGGRA